MRHWMTIAVAIAVFGLLTSARASTVDMDRWFVNATQFGVNGNAVAIAKPDFLGGTSMRSQCNWVSGANLPPLQNGIWQLSKYDRAHQIAYAAATTDQCSSSIFKASPPPMAAPNGDLSNFGTGRGLKIGSSYAQVLAIYGPPEKHGQHFVTRYTANVPDVTAMGKSVKLPETITLVVDDGRVSAITIEVDEGGMF